MKRTDFNELTIKFNNHYFVWEDKIMNKIIHVSSMSSL